MISNKLFGLEHVRRIKLKDYSLKEGTLEELRTKIIRNQRTVEMLVSSEEGYQLIVRDIDISIALCNENIKQLENKLQLLNQNKCHVCGNMIGENNSIDTIQKDIEDLRKEESRLQTSLTINSLYAKKIMKQKGESLKEIDRLKNIRNNMLILEAEVELLSVIKSFAASN